MKQQRHRTRTSNFSLIFKFPILAHYFQRKVLKDHSKSKGIISKDMSSYICNHFYNCDSNCCDSKISKKKVKCHKLQEQWYYTKQNSVSSQLKKKNIYIYIYISRQHNSSKCELCSSHRTVSEHCLLGCNTVSVGERFKEHTWFVSNVSVPIFLCTNWQHSSSLTYIGTLVVTLAACPYLFQLDWLSQSCATAVCVWSCFLTSLHLRCRKISNNGTLSNFV